MKLKNNYNNSQITKISQIRQIFKLQSINLFCSHVFSIKISVLGPTCKVAITIFSLGAAPFKSLAQAFQNLMCFSLFFYHTIKKTLENKIYKIQIQMF